MNTNVSIFSAATFLKIHLTGIENKIKTLLEIGEKEDIPLSFLNNEIFTSKQLETEKKPIFYIFSIISSVITIHLYKTCYRIFYEIFML